MIVIIEIRMREKKTSENATKNENRTKVRGWGSAGRRGRCVEHATRG